MKPINIVILVSGEETFFPPSEQSNLGRSSIFFSTQENEKKMPGRNRKLLTHTQENLVSRFHLRTLDCSTSRIDPSNFRHNAFTSLFGPVPVGFHSRDFRLRGDRLNCRHQINKSFFNFFFQKFSNNTLANDRGCVILRVARSLGMSYFLSHFGKGRSKAKVIKVGQFNTGSRIYIQECRKCGARHESTHILFICQNREPCCNGTMTPVRDFYDVEGEA